MPETEIEIEKPNSCEIAVNAKGQFSGKVKCYAETIEKAYLDAREYSQKLEEFIKNKNKEE